MTPSPPNFTSSALPSRRRSQSRGSLSSGPASFRSSIGGKTIGQKYGSTIAARREQNGSSVSEPGEGGESAPMRAFGSFSATREELRDGSARLASLSLITPSPVSTPPVPTASSSSAITFPNVSPSPRQKAPLQPAASPSNLSLARPSTLFPGHTPPGSNNLDGLNGDGQSGSSPDDDGTTPTQSKMGSVQTPSPEANLMGKTPKPGDHHHRPPTEREKEKERERKVKVLGDETGGDSSPPITTPDEEAMLEQGAVVEDDRDNDADDDLDDDGSGIRPSKPTPANTESTPLLGARPRSKSPQGSTRSSLRRRKSKIVPEEENTHDVAGMAARAVGIWLEKGKKAAKGVNPEVVKDLGKDVAGAVPAVILGTLMNILDGVSYGMIMFPTNVPIFSDFGGIGVSMFFVSCVVSQLVYTGGGSIFKGGNGSMMIEVVPFYHVIVGIIQNSVRADSSIVPTTMVAFALSSILTGLAFWALGALKLGSLSEFFPRHILVGCIGGVGAFLFITGLQVSARLEESEGISLAMLEYFFHANILPLWIVPLVLAIVLRLITSRYSHPLIFPSYFLAIPLVFYAIALAAGISVNDLRAKGWVFEVNGVDSEWYEFWTLYDFSRTDVQALLDTIPTQLALVFFGLLHVPINVPALGISVGEDNVNTDRELVAHGISNVLAGLLGTVPNYLCYVNSVLFYKVGGTTRLSGFMLALASFGVLIAGPGVIGYLPVSVVGALIFILGLDLVKEAVFDTYGRVARFEYITIWCIIFTMTVWDFVMGIGVGIILACVSFVVSSSQRRAIRSVLNGTIARSTVRRHPKQSAFLKEVGKQTRVMKLQGFLFFGTISSCETTIRKILEHASWSSNPIRFLILDFSMASGVDFSAAEAFVRIQRLLEERAVVLVFCGCPADSSVGLALRSVDLWTGGDVNKVEVFENLNDALEHCENAYLRSLYSKDFDSPQITSGGPVSSQIDVPKAELDSDVENFAQSPRASHLRNAAKETMTRADPPTFKTNFQQPLPLLLQSLRPFSPDLNEDYCFRLAPYFKRVHIERGTTLWTNESESDSFYLIESGMLRANYVFQDRQHEICESMVAGTAAGELSFLSRTKRNATVVAERDSVLWKMEISSHEEMGKKEGWAFCRRFEQCLMRIACEEQDVLMGHLISSL